MSISNNDTYHFQESIKLLHFTGSSSDKISENISAISTDYLISTNPEITDWGKNHPRYLSLLAKLFSEGHPYFETVVECLNKKEILLTSYDILYCIVLGIFWRYYYERDIINYAIEEIKETAFYKDNNEIPFTPELDYFLMHCGIENEYSYFRKCSNSIGSINLKWFIDPKVYRDDPRCILYERMRKYNMLGFIYINMREAEDVVFTDADIIQYDSADINKYTWVCYIRGENYNDDIDCKFTKKEDMEKAINTLIDYETIKTREEYFSRLFYVPEAIIEQIKEKYLI